MANKIINWKDRLAHGGAVRDKIPMANAVEVERLQKALIEKQGQFCAAWVDETGLKPSDSAIYMESRPGGKTAIRVGKNTQMDDYETELQRLVHLARAVVEVAVDNPSALVTSPALEFLMIELRKHKDLPQVEVIADAVEGEARPL